ncbi:MAG TPA: M1 family aminopeptidase, partial [Gammaproteobacteria bacterium]|nr:M1 family aminopeptidase [Gammaproteobacteria bacterium]
NWAEGLTTYGADYRLRARRSAKAARALRLRWLQDFASYHRKEPAPALREFQAPVDEASRTLGYNKAAFLWIMLRDRLGAQTFRTGLRRFYRLHLYREASWDDLRHAFEQVSDRDLGPFFRQWLDRPGAPQLRIAALRQAGGSLRLTLAQSDPPYRLRLPVRIRFPDGGTRRETVVLTGHRQRFRWPVAGRRVASVTVDPGYRVFRRLAPEEVPPRISAILARPGGTIGLSPSRNGASWQAAARRLGHALWGGGARVGRASPGSPAVRVVSPEQLADTWRSVDGIRSLPRLPEGATARVLLGRRGPGKPVTLLVAADSPDSLAALAGPLPHYGSYGWLAFRGRKNLAKGRWPVPGNPLHGVPSRPGKGG